MAFEEYEEAESLGSRYIKIGDMLEQHFSESALQFHAIVDTNGVVIVDRTPTVDTQVLRLIDIGGADKDELKRFAFFYGL